MLKKLLTITFFLNALALSLYAQQDCPKITILGPSGLVQKGEPMTFIAKIEYANERYIKSYNWTVDKGKIVTGQGTLSITIDTSSVPGGETVEATLKLGLDGFLKDCGNKKSEVVEVGALEISRRAQLIERMKNPNCEYRQMMMDSFFNELNNDPNAMGYIFTFGGPRAVARVEKAMRANLKWRNYDPSRIVFVNGGGKSKKPTIDYWLVPAGADIPTPESPVEDEADFEKPGGTTEIVTNPKEPFIHSREYYDGGSCIGDDPQIDLDDYAKYLKKNPKSRGNIVIIMMTKADFRQKEREILSYLAKKGIARKRLKTFHQKTYGGVELWILP